MIRLHSVSSHQRLIILRRIFTAVDKCSCLGLISSFRIALSTCFRWLRFFTSNLLTFCLFLQDFRFYRIWWFVTVRFRFWSCWESSFLFRWLAALLQLLCKGFSCILRLWRSFLKGSKFWVTNLSEISQGTVRVMSRRGFSYLMLSFCRVSFFRRSSLRYAMNFIHANYLCW